MVTRYVAWGTLTEEAREEQRRGHRRRRKLRTMGLPPTVDSPDRAIAYVRRLHDEGGMSFRQIAESAPLSNKGANMAESTVGDLYKGYRVSKEGSRPITRLPRETEYRILAVRMPVMDPNDALAQVPSVGTRRRLQALAVAGYGVRVIGRWMGAEHNYYHRLMIGVAGTDRHTYRLVTVGTRERVREMYEKLINTSPSESGVSNNSLARARNAALARGYLPGWVWDDDTIEDPDAFPEWTGACGTPEGYRVHVRETIFNNNPLPLCSPCREAVETRTLSPAKVIFLKDNFATALADSGIPLKALARKVFGEQGAATGRDTLYRWKDGSRSPRYAGQVQLLADALDVDPSYLMDEEAMAQKESEPVIGAGQFNPYVLRAALEMSATSYVQMARLPGSTVTDGAVAKWAMGKMKPASPDKLEPIARHLGVPVEVFYQ